MNFDKKNALLHKIHAWVSLIINFLIPNIVYVIQQEAFLNLIFIGILLLLSIGWVINRISYDMLKNDISHASIIFQYICVLCLSGIVAFVTHTKVSLLAACIVCIAIIVETFITIIICYRYRIKRIFGKK